MSGVVRQMGHLKMKMEIHFGIWVGEVEKQEKKEVVNIKEKHTNIKKSTGEKPNAKENAKQNIQDKYKSLRKKNII